MDFAGRILLRGAPLGRARVLAGQSWISAASSCSVRDIVRRAAQGARVPTSSPTAPGAARAISPLDLLVILSRSLAGTKQGGMLSDTLDLLLAGGACSRGAAYTASAGALELVADHGLPRQHRASLERLGLAGAPWFVAQRAAQQRKIVIDDGRDGGVGPVDRAALAAAGWGHIVACPLAVGRQVHGAIVLAWPSGEEPPAAALATLEVACNLVALQMACQTDVQRRAEGQHLGARAARLTALGLLAGGFAEDARARLAEVARGLGEQQSALDGAPDRVGSPPVMARGAAVSAALQRAQASAERFLAITERGAPDRLDLREIAADAVALIQPIFRDRRVDIDLRGGAGHVVVGRRGELLQVVVQLLVNVIGAPDERGEPRSEDLIPRGYVLGIERRASEEIVTVTDAGDDASGARASLFDEVKQMNETVVDFAVAQEIVVAHEGHIEMGAAGPRGGVSCSVVLPAAGRAADLASRYAAIGSAPAHLQRQLADGVRPVVLWIDGDDLFLEIMVQSLPEFEVRVARSAAQATQILAYGSEPALILCNVRLPDRPGHALHSELAARNPRVGRRFVFIADGVLTPEIAGYLIRSRCPTLMRPIDLDQIRSLALREGISARDAGGAPTLSAQPPPGAGDAPLDPADSTERLFVRAAVTTPSLKAVHPLDIPDLLDRRTHATMAPPPAPTIAAASAPVIPARRDTLPSQRRPSDGPPAASFRDQELAAITQAAVAALRRDGPKRGVHVVALLRARGLAETEALAVITYGLSRGLIVRDPPPSTLLRAADAQRKRTVLVVDDDYDLRETMRDVLEEEGYVVQTASNGQDALDRLQEGEAPEVVLLDLMMPVMDGWHFLDEIARDRALADIPVVVMSASKEGLRSFGDKVFLSKPLDYHNLIATVARSLEGRPGEP
jgi:CheY-like chemotaxis protein/signal transduction histidine kinase